MDGPWWTCPLELVRASLSESGRQALDRAEAAGAQLSPHATVYRSSYGLCGCVHFVHPAAGFGTDLALPLTVPLLENR